MDFDFRLLFDYRHLIATLLGLICTIQGIILLKTDFWIRVLRFNSELGGVKTNITDRTKKYYRLNGYLWIILGIGILTIANYLIYIRAIGY